MFVSIANYTFMHWSRVPAFHRGTSQTSQKATFCCLTCASDKRRRTPKTDSLTPTATTAGVFKNTPAGLASTTIKVTRAPSTNTGLPPRMSGTSGSPRSNREPTISEVFNLIQQFQSKTAEDLHTIKKDNKAALETVKGFSDRITSLETQVQEAISSANAATTAVSNIAASTAYFNSRIECLEVARDSALDSLKLVNDKIATLEAVLTALTGIFRRLDSHRHCLKKTGCLENLIWLP